jgi:CheY-like chemotaxis protein
VIDTGIGISPDKLDAVFEAFRQAEAGTDRKYGGTGLGLTISQALCVLMGHHIEVSSEPGKGPTFSLVFGSTHQGEVVPVVDVGGPDRVAVRATDSVRATPVGGLQGVQVLVIDDELDARILLKEMLDEFGCHVLAARSGEEGLRMAREFRPHLITVDLMMPSLHGADVIRAIKGDPELRPIPVVVVSVVAAESRGQILGAVEVLEKPIQRKDLLAVLQRNVPPLRPRILVVDDEENGRQLMLSQLQDAADVDTAEHGQEALKKLDECSYNLIFLDIVMPVMDGMTFLDALRVHPQHRRIPVIVLTAKELTEEETRRLQRQAQDVLKKAEVFGNDLEHALRHALGQGGSAIGRERGSSEGENTGMAS